MDHLLGCDSHKNSFYFRTYLQFLKAWQERQASANLISVKLRQLLIFGHQSQGYCILILVYRIFLIIIILFSCDR